VRMAKQLLSFSSESRVRPSYTEGIDRDRGNDNVMVQWACHSTMLGEGIGTLPWLLE